MGSFWLLMIGCCAVIFVACVVEAVLVVRNERREQKNAESEERPLTKTQTENDCTPLGTP